MPTSTPTPSPTATRLIWWARHFSMSASTPNARSPTSASPLSFSSTRPYLAFGCSRGDESFPRLSRPKLLAELIARKPSNQDVLADLGDIALDQVLDRDRGILYKGLKQQADLGLVLSDLG